MVNFGRLDGEINSVSPNEEARQWKEINAGGTEGCIRGCGRLHTMHDTPCCTKLDCSSIVMEGR